MALSGTQTTRIAVGGGGRAYGAITAKTAAGQVLIDGAVSVTLTATYHNIRIGSDNTNGKWDILGWYKP